jgi:hypothetical protein
MVRCSDSATRERSAEPSERNLSTKSASSGRLKADSLITRITDRSLASSRRTTRLEPVLTDEILALSGDLVAGLVPTMIYPLRPVAVNRLLNLPDKATNHQLELTARCGKACFLTVDSLKISYRPQNPSDRRRALLECRFWARLEHGEQSNILVRSGLAKRPTRSI